MLINTFKISSSIPVFSEEFAPHVLNVSIASWLYLAKIKTKTEIHTLLHLGEDLRCRGS